MDNPRFRVEKLGAEHRAARREFACGVAVLDLYLRERASQDMRRGVAVVYVLWDARDQRLAGFYTLSTGAVERPDLPPDIGDALPRYAALPVMLLGRLALSEDEAYRGQGLGGALLVDALQRARLLSRDIGSVGVIVDAKDEQVRAFYERYSFRRLPEQPFRLFLPMGTIDLL